MAKDIKFNLRLNIDGKEQIITATSATQELQRAFKTAQQAAKGFSARVKEVGDAVFAIKNITGVLKDLSNSFNDLTAESRSFSEQMRVANTLAGKDESVFAQMKDQVAELSKTIPMARDALARGLYQVISSDLPEDNWMSLLETSARSAVGSMANLNEIVSVTATVVKNYGLAWSEAATIQDKIQLTAKNGETTFEQMAQALPRVTASAATLGITIDELMGVFATLTGVSGDTAEVSTQLSAVLNSLIKPSQTASKMAQEMGIQFDAAAIKAAGGFANFLQQLDASIKGYAQATGTLDTEIYGRLFRNAEALRALIPLTGELKDRFVKNIGEMAGSAGTMDAAFEQMSKTGTSQTQLLKNEIGEFTDYLSDATSGVLPAINAMLAATTPLMTAFVSLTLAANAFNASQIKGKVLAAASTAATYAQTAAQKVAAGVTALWTYQQKLANRQQIAWAFGAKAFAAQCFVMRAAITGLMVVTGVGIAIAAVSAIIALFASNAGDAAEETKKLENAAKSAEAAHNATAETLKNERAELEQNIARLKEFNGTKEQEKALVQQLNNKYGESMGYFSSVSAWYKALTANSATYCRQMEIEAQTRLLANQIAEKTQEQRNIRYDEKGNLRTYSSARQKREQHKKGGDLWEFEEIEIAGTSELDKANYKYKSLGQEIAATRKQLEALVKEQGKLTFDVKGSDKQPVFETKTATGGGVKAGKSAKTEETPLEIGSIDYYEKELARLQKEIKSTSDIGLAKELQREVDMLQSVLSNLKIKIGIDKPSAKEAESSATDITKDISDRFGTIKPLEFDDAVTNADKTKTALEGTSAAVQSLGNAFSAAGQAFEEPVFNIMGTIAQAVATLALTFANSLKGTFTPWDWIAAAASGTATLISVIASIKQATAFADGGIVSGPTYALVGEYSGARNNPEVIAPLNKLRSLIGTPEGAGNVEFRIEGRDLVGVLNKQSRHSARA